MKSTVDILLHDYLGNPPYRELQASKSIAMVQVPAAHSCPYLVDCAGGTDKLDERMEQNQQTSCELCTKYGVGRNQYLQPSSVSERRVRYNQVL